MAADWMNRYSMENALSTSNIDVSQRRGMGPNGEVAPLTGWTDEQVLSNRLAGLQRQYSRTMKEQSNVHPLGAVPMSEIQKLVDLTQSVTALGQKVANPNKPIQFAPERGVSTTPNQTQAGWANQRAQSSRSSALAGQSQAASLDALNVGNARAEDAAMEAPGFGDVAGAKANYTQGANRRMAALGRQRGGY